MNFQLTPRLKAQGTILCCSEAPPASADDGEPILSHPEGSKIPSDALKLPLHRGKSAQGGPEDRTAGVLVLGCPRPLLPRRTLLEPGSGGRRGCSGSPPRPPLAPATPHTRPLPPHPRPGAPRSRRCLKGPQPDFQVGSASGPGAAGPVRMREARAGPCRHSDSHGCLRNQPLRLGKAGALRGGARVSGLRGSCLTSPRGRQERLRTDGRRESVATRRSG